MTVKQFQKLPRMEQLRCLVSDKIKNGYTLSDFQRDYKASTKDCEEFLQIRREIMYS